MLGSYAIFCDDVRQETNGKLIYIGVYDDELYFEGAAPWALRQLCVDIRVRLYRELAAFPATVRIVTKTADSEDVLWSGPEHTVLPEVSKGALLQFEKPESSRRMIKLQYSVILSPLVLEGDTRLEVQMVAANGTVVVDRLRMRGRLPSDLDDF